MTEHLPECPEHLWCICSYLRACEERVSREERAKWSDLAHDNWQYGWEDGLRDAREAVESRKTPCDLSCCDTENSTLDGVLRAIAALKEDSDD